MAKKKSRRRSYRQTPPGKCGTAFEARCVFVETEGFGHYWSCMLFDRMGKRCGGAEVDTSKKPASIKFQN